MLPFSDDFLLNDDFGEDVSDSGNAGNGSSSSSSHLAVVPSAAAASAASDPSMALDPSAMPSVDSYIARDAGSGIYWCRARHKQSPRRQDMTRHVERKHFSTGYQCHVCKRPFRAKDQMLKHVRKVHQNKSF